MLRKTIFASAAAVALCFAASAAITNASAAPFGGGFRIPHHVGTGGPHQVGTGGLVVRPGAGRTRCWSAECGGGTVPIDDKFVMRGCQFLKGEALPPWCQGIPGAPRGKTRGLRY
ncbi:MAG: hypothetical protein WCE79_19330 [Xanthobacteraceae bacterium]